MSDIEPDIPEEDAQGEEYVGPVEETKGSESEEESTDEEGLTDDISYEDDEPNDKLGPVEDDGDSISKQDNLAKGYLPYEESDEDDSSDSESDEEEEYTSKVDLEKKIEYIKATHGQEISKTYEEMVILTKIKRRKNKNDGEDIIDDPTHTTIPILTKYEKTRILGLRVSQLNEGAPRYINVPSENIIDNYIIAEKELRQKKLPFIVTRPLPNGEKEHWRLEDLEIL